jgi:putative transposase
MRRQILPGLPHHLIHRGNNRRRIFSYAFDFCRLLQYIVEAAEDTACVIAAGVLMSNHLHLVVTPPTEAALPRFVKSWAQRFALNRNRRREGSGKLFEERYRSRALTSDEALAAATTYVDLNPVRAGLVLNPAEYRWSTAALQLGVPQRDWPLELWRPSPWYLALGADSAQRAAQYSALLDGLRGAPADGRIARLKGRCSQHYTRRLERPDGTSARELLQSYCVMGKKRF